MPSASELNEKFKDMKVSELKDLIRKHNLHYVIKGYSRMKKAELLSTIVKHFSTKEEETKPKKKVKLIIKPTTKPTKKYNTTYSKEELEDMEKVKKENELLEKAQLKYARDIELPRYMELIKIAMDKKQLTEREAKQAIKEWKISRGL